MWPYTLFICFGNCLINTTFNHTVTAEFALFVQTAVSQITLRGRDQSGTLLWRHTGLNEWRQIYEWGHDVIKGFSCHFYLFPRPHYSVIMFMKQNCNILLRNYQGIHGISAGVVHQRHSFMPLHSLNIPWIITIFTIKKEFHKKSLVYSQFSLILTMLCLTKASEHIRNQLVNILGLFASC